MYGEWHDPDVEYTGDPRPRGRDYNDPVVFARELRAWQERRAKRLVPPSSFGPGFGQDPRSIDTLPYRALFDGPGEGENR